MPKGSTLGKYPIVTSFIWTQGFRKFVCLTKNKWNIKSHRHQDICLKSISHAKELNYIIWVVDSSKPPDTLT